MPFSKEGTIRTSPGVTEEDCATSVASRLSTSNLEKTLPQFKSDESRLGYHSVLDFLVLGILVGGNHAICKIMYQSCRRTTAKCRAFRL